MWFVNAVVCMCLSIIMARITGNVLFRLGQSNTARDWMPKLTVAMYPFSLFIAVGMGATFPSWKALLVVTVILVVCFAGHFGTELRCLCAAVFQLAYTAADRLAGVSPDRRRTKAKKEGW